MNTGKKSQKKEPVARILFWICIATIIILLSGKLLYPLTNKEAIILNVPLSGTTIYLDNKKKVVTTTRDEKVILKTIPGTHSVVSHKKGHWPWEKSFVVAKKSKQYASIFNIKRSPSFSLIPEYTLKENVVVVNDDHKTILALFENDLKKRVSESGMVSIETLDGKDGNILATWLDDKNPTPYYFCRDSKCDKTFYILPVAHKIRQIDFYPGREDVIIFSSKDAVWVTELDRNDQNTQLIHIGTAPDFVRGPGNTIYVKDSGKLMQVNL